MISKVDSSTDKSMISPSEVPATIRLSYPMPILCEFDVFLNGHMDVNDLFIFVHSSLETFKGYTDFMPIKYA